MTVARLLEHVNAREMAAAQKPVVHIRYKAKLPGLGGGNCDMQAEALRHDGKLYWRQRVWGDVPARGRVREAQAGYLYEIYDGERFCRIARTPNAAVPRTFQWVRDPAEIDRRLNSWAGHFSPDRHLLWEQRSLPALLEQATESRIVTEKARAYGHDVVVLEVKSPAGDYTLSYAPALGYALVSVEMLRLPAERARQTASLHGEQYENVGGVWYPMKVRGTIHSVDGNAPLCTSGNCNNLTEHRMGVLIDVEYLHADLPANADSLLCLPPMRENDMVSFDDDPNPDGTQRYYRYRNGEYVPQ